MTAKDPVIEIHIVLLRDGTVTLRRDLMEPVAAHRVVELGMLTFAQTLISSEFKIHQGHLAKREQPK